jgi:hypothetical protein
VDGLRTWQAINPQDLPVHDSIFQIWLGPSAGKESDAAPRLHL